MIESMDILERVWQPRQRLKDMLDLLPAAGRAHIRLRTLTLTRWVAVVGQAFTIILVHVSFGFDLPLVPVLGAIAVSAGLNLVLWLRNPPTARVTERAAALLLGYDLIQLAFLLLLTGGLQNPFAALLLVPVTISATVLSLGTTIGLCILVMAALSVLALVPSELPWSTGGLDLPDLYIGGSWFALALSAVLIAAYVWRVADEARRMSDALAATQMALAREQQLSALGGLAAGAAHELGSPLTTIAITAREVQRNLPPDSPLAEDVAELVGQSRRCRDILRTLTTAGADDGHERFTRVPFSALMSELAGHHTRTSVEVRITVRGEGDEAPKEPHIRALPEIRHALGNLIQNAIQFAHHVVEIDIHLTSTRITLRIADDGPGFSADVLEEIGEPYISSRRGEGGLGLGVFIAQTLLARTGARLRFDNPGRGAQVTIEWDRDHMSHFGEAPDDD